MKTMKLTLALALVVVLGGYSQSHRNTHSHDTELSFEAFKSHDGRYAVVSYDYSDEITVITPDSTFTQLFESPKEDIIKYIDAESKKDYVPNTPAQFIDYKINSIVSDKGCCALVMYNFMDASTYISPAGTFTILFESEDADVAQNMLERCFYEHGEGVVKELE